MQSPATIVVLVKHAVDPLTVVIDPLTGQPDPGRLVAGPDPTGLQAAAWALAARDALRASGRGARVVAVVAGPSDAVATARHVIALGVDEAIRADIALHPHDPMTTARALALAAPMDALVSIVVAGTSSADRSSGVVPPAFAEIVGLRYAGDVMIESPDQALGPDEVTFVTLDPVGRRVACSCPLPVVLGIRAASVPVPAISLERRLAAQQALIPVVRIAAVGHQADASSICPPRLPPHLRPAPEGERPEERLASLMTAGSARRAGRVVQGQVGVLVEAAMQFLVQGGFLGPAEDET